MASVADILAELAQANSVAQTYMTGGLRLQLKTNYTPALTIYDEAAGPSGIANALGVVGGIRVLDAQGNQLAQVGAWPATDPLRVAGALGVLGLAGIGLVRLLRGGSRRR
jgi:hypothetical protein